MVQSLEYASTKSTRKSWLDRKKGEMIHCLKHPLRFEYGVLSPMPVLRLNPSFGGTEKKDLPEVFGWLRGSPYQCEDYSQKVAS